MPFVMGALFVHETAHIVAARACGAEIEYIEIMPFGGAAKVRELYSERGWALVIVALAGPLANGIMMLAGAALGWWRVLEFGAALEMVKVNGALMAFNMLPALPLDGGRVMYAMLRRFFGRRRAVDAGAVIAYGIAALMAAWAVYGLIQGGQMNVSLVIMAVFLISSGWSERTSALDEGAGRTVMGICREKKLPGRARLVAVHADGALSRAARFLGGRETVIFAMMKEGRIVEMVGEGDAAQRMLREE